MISQTRLIKLRDSLTAIEGLKVYHYWRTNIKPPYCIWAEDGEDRSVEADGEKKEQDAIIYVDFFTLTEFDPLFDQIQTALNTTGNRWKWTSTSYEEQTNLIHHTWQIWVL